jgi:shikimate dehydrogenase
MQNAALAELGLAGEWSYEAIEVAPERFDGVVRGLPSDGFAGVNITVPLKLAALALADEASAGARQIGAANTLTFDGARIAADNTDAVGITAAIGEPVGGRSALVLGAGGSGRAAVWALREAGARVAIWNRTAAQAEVLAAEFGVDLAPTEAERPAIAGFDLILNATTVGLEQANTHEFVPGDLKALPMDADAIHEPQVVVDLVYGSYETALASHARRRGARVIDGLEVLVHQGAASLRIWTGLDPPIETMRRAARGE